MFFSMMRRPHVGPKAVPAMFRLTGLAVLACAGLALPLAPDQAHARDQVSAVPATISIPGPKRTLAVGGIEASGGFAPGENWDVGDALSSMLSQTLAATGLFVILERSALPDLLNERQLQTSRVAGGSNDGAKLTAAQFLVVGSVTEFGGARKGGGLSIGGLGLGGGARGGVALNTQSGKIRIDLRVVDARSGEVLRAFTVSRSASRSGLGLTSNFRGLSAGANGFVATPLGDATRRALEDAAPQIAATLAARPWQGRVVEWDEGSVIVNAGSETGVAVGDRLRLERLRKSLTDPETGRLLSDERYSLGEVFVQSVEPKIARGNFVPVDGSIVPQRGDFLVFIGKQP